MTFSPTDQSGYVGPKPTRDSVAPNFPRWLVHPTLDSVMVADTTQEAAVTKTDPAWAPATPSVLGKGKNPGGGVFKRN